MDNMKRVRCWETKKLSPLSTGHPVTCSPYWLCFIKVPEYWVKHEHSGHHKARNKYQLQNIKPFQQSLEQYRKWTKRVISTHTQAWPPTYTKLRTLDVMMLCRGWGFTLTLNLIITLTLIFLWINNKPWLLLGVNLVSFSFHVMLAEDKPLPNPKPNLDLTF
jgi:hypothetical protein